MRAEKKMIVGSTPKAKRDPVLATRPALVSRLSFGPGTPTAMVLLMRFPKMKLAPWPLKARRPLTASPTRSKTQRPGVVLRTITPKVAWRRSPIPTRRQDTFQRS